MVQVINYPLNSSDAMDKWRRETEERDLQRVKTREERRRANVVQTQIAEWSAWLDARIAEPTAEGSPLDQR